MLANYENLKGHGFNERTAREQREIASRGGKASGEARRKKADFRKDINTILTTLMPDGESSEQLRSLGLDPTIGMGLHMKMVAEVLQNGNVKAYEALARYSGQSDRTDADMAEQKARTAQAQAQADKTTRETSGDEYEDGVEVINDAPTD